MSADDLPAKRRTTPMDCEQSATPAPVDLLRDDAAARGLAALTMQIESFEQKAGVHHFYVAATAGGRRVGFLIELCGSEYEPVALPTLGIELPRCHLMLLSTGEESDLFVAAVAAVYDLDLPAGHMPEALEFDAVCLAGEPAAPQLGPMQLILFYHGHAAARRGEELRFQWFLRIDITQGELGFVDQAAENHAHIVAALSGAAPWRH
jgi:hypothetical protein